MASLPDRARPWPALRLPDRVALGLVCGLGLAVRVAHLVDYRRLPLFDRPTVDAALYVDLAKQLAEGAELPAVFYKPPLYPALLALAWKIWGADWFWLRMPGVLCGVATGAIVWWLGRRLFGPGVAFLAGLAWALHRTATFFEGELLETGLVTGLHAAALALVLRVPPGAASRRPAIVAGLALGLGTVARPTLLLFDAVALLWLGRRRAPAALLGVVLAIAPVTFHNAWRGHDFVLVSSNLGVNFYLGNNPRADGRSAAADVLPANPAAAERAARDQATAASAGALRPSQVSAYWLRRGLEHALGHPIRTLSLLGRKVVYAWNVAEISDNEDLGGLVRRLWVVRGLPSGAWFVVPLGLAGLWLAPRTRDLSLLRLFVLAQFASLLPFFVVARFRLPWMPALAVLAAWVVVAGFERWRARAAGRGRLAGVVGAAALVCGVPACEVRAPVDFDLDYKLGYAYQQRGDTAAALAAYRDALARDPHHALAANAVGVLLAAQGGDLGAAAAAIERALLLDPERAEHYAESLAGVELRRGRPAAALAAIDRGLLSDPDPGSRGALLVRAAEAHRALGDRAAEIAALRAAIAVLPTARSAAARSRLGALESGER